MVDDLPPPPSHRDDEAHQYSHSGARYLLGYGDAFFGIWDRSAPGHPIERFPRTRDGWAEAWTRFVQLEPEHAEVGLGSSPVPAEPPEPAEPSPSRAAASGARAGNPANPAWWLLPILMGWMGGVIAWLLIRDQDRGRARAMLIAGIVATVFWFALYASMAPTPSS